MRKFFTSSLRKNAGLMALVAFAFLGTASAQADAVAMGTVEFGKVYEIPSGSSVTGTIEIPQDVTPGKNGKIRLTQDGVTPGFCGLNLYIDGKPAENSFIGYNGKYGAINDYYVKPGDVYQINEDFIMNGGKVAFFLEGVSTQPLAVQYINITPGSTVNFALYPRLSITFNQAIAAIPTTGHKMYFKSRKGGVLTEVNLPYSAAGWDLYTPCKTQLTAGTLLPGDEFQVMLTGIRTTAGAACENADADGNIWFTFKVGSEPLTSVSQHVPSTFLSYYAPGDSEGIISITFTNPMPGVENKIVITDETKVIIGYGDLEGEDYYNETFKPTLSEDGMTIYADLTGKLRTPQIMVPGATAEYTEIGIGIQNIYDMYGNPVKAENSASIGSFGWTLPYKEIERTNFVAEFNPANGETLVGAENIEVMIYPATGYTFTGFEISYPGENGVVEKLIVDKANANESISDDIASYKFAIPEKVKGKKNVTVTLANLVCNDGYDHTTDIMAQYDAFVITYSDPSNNAGLATLKENQIISIETNYSEKYPEMAIAYEVVDMNPTLPENEIVKTSSDMTRQSDGSYSATLPAAIKLYAGHSYQLRFTAWATADDKNYSKEPIGTACVTISGTTPAYVPSVTVLQSINPVAGTELGDETPVFTVVFDGMVEINADATAIIGNANAGNIKFASITAVDPIESDGQTFATEWKLAVPEDFYKDFKGVLSFTVAADDMQGRRVQGNKGVDENSYFEFSYNAKSEYEKYTVEVVGTAPYASVKEFVAKAPERGGISYSSLVPYNEAFVTDGRRAIVAHVANVIAPEAEAGQRVKEVTIVLDTEITEGGSYMLVIPKNYFILGEGDDSKNSDELMYGFEVAGAEAEVKIEYTPATGDVTSLPKEIVMNFIGTTGIMTGSGVPTLTIDNGEPIKLNDVVLDDYIYTQCTLVLPQEYTEPGEYKVNFPAGYFSLGDEGDPSPAYEAVWTIKSGSAINVTTNPAQGKVTSLSSIEITFVDYEEVGGGTGKATLSVNGGAPVNLPDAGWGTEFNQMEQTLGQTYTADGTYVISFPEGYFSLGSNGDASPAFTLTYTIGDNSGIAGVTVATDGLYHVYTVSGVEVLTTADFAEVLSLAPGLYIVNNSKVYIK